MVLVSVRVNMLSSDCRILVSHWLIFSTLLSLAPGQRQPRGCVIDGIDMCGYESHQEMVGKLRNLQLEHPTLVRVNSIGRSVRGQDLVYIKISGNVGRRSFMEPMFKYVGNMHGNEVVGRQLLIYLAQYLVTNYGRDQRITSLVNNTEIFLMPTLNPDGYQVSSEGACTLGRGSGRENARNRDLNRNFPRRLEDANKPYEQLLEDREPETQAAMHWIRSTPFVLSANLHGGAVVASYPYDDSRRHISRGFYSGSPDDKMFRYLAETYSRNHRVMHRNIKCTPDDNFPGGVTNGAHWYDVPGDDDDDDDFDIDVDICRRNAGLQLHLQQRI